MAPTEADPRAFTSVNPSTEAEIARYSRHGGAEVERRLEASRAAFAQWSRLAVNERARYVHELAKQLRSRAAASAALMTAEMGKPVTEALAEIEKCAGSCEYFAANSAEFLADVPAPSDSARSRIAFRPLGGLLAVMPWNFPYWQVIRAAVPALCAGNVFILKHAPNVLGCALDIEDAFREAGFPDGTFTNLIIDASEVADVIADPRVAAVTLTGSERAGVAVATAAGANLKKAVLELGGSDAFVVLPGADVVEAARVGAASRFQNAGQSCIAAKRFIVVESIRHVFTEAFVAQTVALRPGDPGDEATRLGPLARSDLRDNLERQLRDTVAAGGRVLTGGTRPDRPGWFFEPTVVGDVTPGMAAGAEETFGPLAAIIAVEDEEEALTVANGSRFGLGGNLWTGDVERGLELAARFESGGVFINGMTHSDWRLPFGGIKRSGHGRELHEFGIREFTNVQTVWLPG